MTIQRMFANLFAGRTDAYGTEYGGCEWAQSERHVAEYITRVADHLDGVRPLGVYPAYPGPESVLLCWWGCVDLDEGEDSLDDAMNLINLLHQFNIIGWLERSRSKGYHVWVFAEAPVTAETMRNALLAACQMVDAPDREVFPKQTSLAPGKVGNYVRLPYPGALAKREQPLPTERQIVLNEQDLSPYIVGDFLDAAEATRSTPNELDELAKLYQPPAPQRRRLDSTEATEVHWDRILQWVTELPEGNRNNGLFWAACQAFDSLIEAAMVAGLSEHEARKTVASAAHEGRRPGG